MGRITAGFILLALAVIAVFATVTLLVIDYDLNAAAHRQQRTNVAAITAALQRAYNEDHSWTAADLAPTVALAHAYGVSLDMNAQSKAILSITANAAEGPTAAFDVVSNGKVVAHVTLRQPSSGVLPADAGLRHTITTSVIVTALIAVVLAVISATLLARRLSQPLDQLATAVRHLGRRNQPAAQLDPPRGPREVRELMSAFNTMSSDLRLEDQLRRDLTANVAHELRTPLSILQVQTSALADGVADWSPAAARSLEEEVARLGRLVEDLGTLAEAQSASLSIEMAPVRLDHLATDVTQRLGHRFDERRIRTTLDVSPVTVVGDPDRISQIISNLLTNAARYARQGGEVRIVVCDKDQPTLVVSDNGPGIPEREQAAIFERFARGSTAAGVPGSGIGLAVVQELVRAHGGTIQLRRSAEGGSEFIIRFPPVHADPFSTGSTPRLDSSPTSGVSDGHMTRRTPPRSLRPVSRHAGGETQEGGDPHGQDHTGLV
jgi:signal transduction histidine kinase